MIDSHRLPVYDNPEGLVFGICRKKRKRWFVDVILDKEGSDNYTPLGIPLKPRHWNSKA